jgi:hypothetical protein
MHDAPEGNLDYSIGLAGGLHFAAFSTFLAPAIGAQCSVE